MKRCFFIFLLILCLLPCLAGAEEESDALYPIRENGLWGYMNRAGETVIPPQWKMALPFSGDMAFVSLADVTNPYLPSLSKGHYDGLIDRQGNNLVEPAPERIVQEYETAWRIVDLDADAEGFYDKASGFYQPPRTDYEMVMPAGDGSGPIAVMNSERKVGYVSRETGETVIPFRYTGYENDDCFYDGYARPNDIVADFDEDGVGEVLDEIEHLIDVQGNEVTLPDGMTPESFVKDGYVVYSIPMETEEAAEKVESPLWDMLGYGDDMPDQRGMGLARLDGTVVIEADRSMVWMSPPDENGMICFLQDTHETVTLGGENWPLLLAGHMDTEGNVIVPPTYNIVDSDYYITYEFVNGYAVIEDFGRGPDLEIRSVIIDTAGNEVFSQLRYPNGHSFFLDDEVQENGLIWYRLTTTVYRDITDSQRGYGLIRIADGRAEYLTEPVFESHAGSVLPERNRELFLEGLHPVQMDGLWGYINERAETVIQPAWDKASSFRDGLALVEKDGKLAYIDHAGTVVWQEANMVYYNPQYGRYYHTVPYCPRVSPLYWPLSPISFETINRFTNLLPCSVCGAPERTRTDAGESE